MGDTCGSAVVLVRYVHRVKARIGPGGTSLVETGPLD